MADAEDVVRGITPQPGVLYTGLWLNDRGFERAVATKRLDIKGTIVLCGSETFLKRNQNRTNAEQLAAQELLVQRYQALGYKVERATIMAAFGCNFEGDVPVARIVDLAGQILDMAGRHPVQPDYVHLPGTMALATPETVQGVCGAL